MAIYKRGKLWHMDVMVDGVRYREALETTDRREASSLERIGSQRYSRARELPRQVNRARKRFSDAADAWVEDRKGHIAERSIQLIKNA